ncbi:MAG: ribonuclease H [Bacteroidetes bacterium]|nr:MAG: ribonuclease H [Bacteroidota bacterium]
MWRGKTPGVYTEWSEAEAQIKGFKGALYRSFPSLQEAEAAYAAGTAGYQATRAQGNPQHRSRKRKGSTPQSQIIWRSISVDAACSGNPGPMEYQGVDTRTKERLFHQAFELGTNNIGEFLGIVHGLALLQKQNLPDLPIYTDSATAIIWVRNRKVKTKLVRNERTEKLYELIERGENWLKNNSYRNPILKWDTESWGEIPADFGRKG